MDKDLSSTPGCGTSKVDRDDVGLKIIGSTSFSVEASENLARPLGRGVCGETNLTEGFLKLQYEWPDFVPVAAQPLPEARMFGAARALVVKLDGEIKNPPAQVIGTPPLTGTAIDEGVTHITVRFIRCGAAHLPAC